MNPNCDKLHILIISNSYPTIFNQSKGTFWRDHALGFSKKGHKIGVIAITPISLREILRKRALFWFKKDCKSGLNEIKFSYPNVPKFNFIESYISLFFGLKFFKKYIQENGKPDVIQLHRFEGGLLAMSLKNKYDIPVVYTEHSSRFLYNQLSNQELKIARKITSKSDFRIAVSPTLKEKLQSDFNFDFNYIPNTVDTKFYNRDSQTTKEKLFTFFAAGHLGENKNHKVLIKAFHSFYLKNKESQLIIGGEGHLKSLLQGEIDRMGMSRNIHLVGQLTKSQMLEWYRKSHVFLVSSIKETFGVVIIEAMSVGLPVISSKCGGPESIIVHSNLGELVEGTENSFLLAMNQVYKNYLEFSPEEIIKFVELNYSEEVILERLVHIYRKLL